MERVNYAVEQVSDTSMPGIKNIIQKLGAEGTPVSPNEFLERCLDLAGPVVLGQDTREGLVAYAESGGDLVFDTPDQKNESETRISRMLQLIVSTREYQFN